MRHKYYPEDELIAKLESGEFTWLDYVNHFSEEWQNEYQEYCKENYWCPLNFFHVPKIKVGFLAWNPTFFRYLCFYHKT